MAAASAIGPTPSTPALKPPPPLETSRRVSMVGFVTSTLLPLCHWREVMPPWSPHTHVRRLDLARRHHLRHLRADDAATTMMAQHTEVGAGTSPRPAATDIIATLTGPKYGPLRPAMVPLAAPKFLPLNGHDTILPKMLLRRVHEASSVDRR